MSIKDIEITVGGGTAEVRSAVCGTIQNVLTNTGFADITNTDAEPDADVGDSLMDQAIAKYPDILKTPVTISSVTSEEEVTETVIEEDEDELLDTEQEDSDASVD